MKCIIKIIILSMMLATIPRVTECFEWLPMRACGGLPGEYLTTFSPSARIGAMGGAGASSATDCSGVYLNPALISSSPDRALMLTVCPLWYDGAFSYAGIVYPTEDVGCLALSRTAITSGIAEKRDALGYETGTFQDSQSAYNLAYARNVRKIGIDVGGSLKFVSQSLDGEHDTGFGVDIGAFRRWDYPDFSCFSAALCIQNLLSPSLTLIDSRETFPSNVYIGISYCYQDRLLISGDVRFLNVGGPCGHPIRWFFGQEYRISRQMSVRLGVNDKAITAGFGIDFRRIAIDYACIFGVLGPLHQFSCDFRFGILPSAEEDRVMRERARWEEYLKAQSEELRKRKKALSELLAETKEARIRLKKEKNILVHKMDALAQMERGQYDKAKQQLKKILELRPTDEQVQELLVHAERKLKEAAAQKHFEAAKKYYDSGNYRQSAKYLDTALSLYPEHRDAIILKYIVDALVLADEGKYIEARRKAQYYITIRPKDKNARSLVERLDNLIRLFERGRKIK